MPPTLCCCRFATRGPAEGLGKAAAAASPAVQERGGFSSPEQVALSPLPAVAFAIAHKGRRSMQKST